MPAEAHHKARLDAAACRCGPASLLELFLVFSGLALRGFGGVLPWAQRVLVEERQWLTREEFLETLAFGQLLPGPNVCNVAIMVGDRWFGWRGSVAALGGMILAPLALVLLAISVYNRSSEWPLLRHALAGMGAVAGGLFLATAVKLAMGTRKHWRWWGFGLLAFIGLAVLRWPMALLMLVLAPLAVGLARWLRPAARPRPPGPDDRDDAGDAGDADRRRRP